jgi:hypothetical protein
VARVVRELARAASATGACVILSGSEGGLTAALSSPGLDRDRRLICRPSLLTPIALIDHRSSISGPLLPALEEFSWVAPQRERGSIAFWVLENAPVASRLTFCSFFVLILHEPNRRRDLGAQLEVALSGAGSTLLDELSAQGWRRRRAAAADMARHLARRLRCFDIRKEEAEAAWPQMA